MVIISGGVGVIFAYLIISVVLITALATVSPKMHYPPTSNRLLITLHT